MASSIRNHIELKNLLNEDFHFDYRKLHLSFIYDKFTRDLNISLKKMSGTMSHVLLASSSDNVRTGRDIVEEAFVNRVCEQGKKKTKKKQVFVKDQR